MMRVMLIGGALALTMCADADHERARVTVRDSAGITIVESDSTTAQLPLWSVVDAPIVTIGEIDGPPEYMIENVRLARRTADARIVIVDAGASSVRIYDEHGRHVRSTGREGEGPGEYRVISNALLGRGDSIHVWDSRLSRVTVLSPAGDFVRSTPLERSEDFRLPMPILQLADGRLVATLNAGVMDPPGTPSYVKRDSVPLVVYSLGGMIEDTLGTWPGSEYFAYISGDGMIVGATAFPRITVIAPLGDDIAIADSERWEVLIVDERGAPRRILRRAHVPGPVPAEEVARYRSLADDTTVPERFRDRIRAMPIPATAPAFEGLVAADSMLWLGERHDDETARSWLVLDVERGVVARVRTPSGFDPDQVGPDWVLGIRRDELGVEQVVILPLRKEARAP